MTSNDGENHPTPSLQCPLCGVEMTIVQRHRYATLYTCAPCRVTVEHPVEPRGVLGLVTALLVLLNREHA